jgi:hypothetical protein
VGDFRTCDSYYITTPMTKTDSRESGNHENVYKLAVEV